MPAPRISDEERERRSRRAKELVAAGKLGGAKFGAMGGRPRVPRASELVAEKVRKSADEIAAAIIDNLSPNKPDHIRLAAARQALEVEAQEERARQTEEREFEKMSDPQLAAFLAEALTGLKGADALGMLFDFSDDDVIDGEAVLVEVEDEAA